MEESKNQPPVAAAYDRRNRVTRLHPVAAVCDRRACSPGVPPVMEVIQWQARRPDRILHSVNSVNSVKKPSDLRPI